MEEFYPSEIARLVLGYLKDAKCPKAWETFLEECSDLDEHSRLYKEGKFCSTNVNGKSLLDVLKEYCVLKREAVIENNQNKCARNTYEYEVLKTPNKANENAFTTIRINQKFQSQSVVSSSLGQVHSPSSRSNIFRTPPSRPSGQTPRRRIECQATPLNFGPEAESVCRTYSDLCINKNANTSLRTPLRKKNSASSSVNTCTSDSVLSIKSKFQERIVHNYANPNFRSHLNEDTTRNQNEHLLPPSACHPKSSEESNIQNTNASRSQDKNADNSNTVAHSTQKENIHNTFDYSDLVQFHDSVSTSEKQNSQTVERPEEGQSTVINKSFTYQSSEITKSQNVPSLENCFTPQYPIDPPHYNRAPFTNSPRIILSHDRSQIPSLTTPMKDTRCWMEDEWSPKRKGSIPRRRLITESPLSKYLQQPENLSFESMLEYMYGSEEELTNNPVVQLLTDNINKVKQNEMLKDQDGKKANEQDVNLENIVKSATELIEEDPILGRYFSVGVREEVNLNAELSAAKSCEVNSRDSEIVESFPSASVESASDKHSNDIQNKNASHNVRDTAESDLLVNALRETFGEITNPLHFSSSNPCIGRENENINNHESFADDHEANVSTNDLSVNIQSSNNEAEGKNDVPDNSCSSTKQSSGLLTSNSVEKSLDRDCVKDKSNLSDGSKTVVDSVQVANTSEDLNNVKNNLEVSGNENVSRADLKNGLSTVTSNCEINQTSQSNASVINTQVVNSAANLQSSNIPSTTTFITPQLPSQPIVEFPVPLPYFGLVQNGVYRIIINSPITWNPTPAGGLCTSTIPTGDIASPLIINPAPVSTVSNVENVETVNTDATPCNTGNFVTPTITNTNQLVQYVNTLTKGIPASPETKTAPKRNQKNTKRKKTEKGDSPQAKKSKKGGSTSSAKQNRKPQKKRVSKRKPLCLFPESPQVENIMATPEKSVDNVPVLSIPDTPSLSGQSSAFKLLSQITGQFEREERSPVLKMLMNNAAMLSQNSSRLNSSHVRCLDFGANLNESIEDNALQTNSNDGKPKEKNSEKSPVQNRRSNALQTNSNEGKPKEKNSEKSPVQNRRSLRIQQSKEKQNLSQGQGKNDLKSKSPSPKRINKRKRSLPKKRPQSTNENSTVDMAAVILNSMEEARQNTENSTIDMAAVILNSMEEARQNAENSTIDMAAVILNSMEEARQNAINARQTSENVPNKVAFSTLPSNQDSQNEVNINLEDVQMTDLEDEVSKNNEKVKLNTCFAVSQSESDQIVNDSSLHSELMQRQGIEISTKERIENVEKCGNSVHNVENVMQEETTEPIVTKGSDLESSTRLKPSEKLTISKLSFIESSHSQTETKNSISYESGKINALSNEKEDSEIKRTDYFTNEKALKRRDLSNYLFGSDSSSDESNLDDSSNIVHEEPTTGNLSVSTNIADKSGSISNHLEAEKDCLEKDKNTHLTVPDCSSKVTSKAGISTIVSSTEEKYPVINKESSAISNSKPLINSETCNQLDGKSKLGCSNKKRTKELSENSVRKPQNSPSIIDIKRQIIEGNSLGTKQRASTVSLNTEKSIAINSDGEITDMPNESFCSYSNKDRENCRMEINAVDSDNQEYIDSVNLCNTARDPCVYPVNASENSKNISNECDGNIQLSVPKTTSNIKEKNTSKICLSSTPKQALSFEKRKRTSSKKSKNVVLKEGNINELSKTGTSLEQCHELIDLTGSDNLEKKSKVVAHEKRKKNISHGDKRRSAFSPDFITWGKHEINNPVMARKQKVDCLSPSAPRNVNKKDKQIIDSDISPITNSCNYNISKPLVLSSVTSVVADIEENSCSTLSGESDYPERVERISDKDASYQTLKKSTKDQQRELKLKNSPLENNQSKKGRSPKTSDLLTKSIDLANQVSCDLKQNLVLSNEERKNLSDKHSNSRPLNSAALFNADKQAGSPVVENHKLSSNSPSIGHNKNVYSNSKNSMHEDYSRRNKDSLDHKISHSNREQSFKTKSPKNAYQPEMLKNRDRFGREFNPVDTNKGSSGIISKSSSYSDSSFKTSPQVITGSLPYTENPKNQQEMTDKIDPSSKASHLLVGKDVRSIEQQNKNKIHSDSKRSPPRSKRDGSQKSVDSKYPDKTYHSRREARERLHSSSGDKNNRFSNVKLTTPNYPTKNALSSSDRAKSSHSNVSKSNKSYAHGKSQRNSDRYEILKTSDYSRYRSYSGSVNSSKGNSKHTFTSRSTEDLNFRKDGYKNKSDSAEHIRASSFAKAKTDKISFALSSTANEMDINSESSFCKRSSTKEKRDHHSYSDSRKSINYSKAQKHDLNPEKSTSLRAKETVNIKDSNFQADNQELAKDSKKISDQETVSIHRENIASTNNKLVVPQDSFTLVDEQAQTSSKVSVKSNNQSSTNSVSAAQNAPITASVKSSTVSDSTVLPQSDDSLTSTSSKDAYGTRKIHRPFKKRIRPIPVDTKSKLGTSSFPFCTGQKTVVTNNAMTPGNPTKIGSVENSVVISSKKIQEKAPEQVDAVRTVSNPVAEMLSSSIVTTASNSISPEKEHLPNPIHIASALVTPTKEIGSTFVTPVKEVLNSLPVFISPSSKSQASYPTTPSPKVKSVFRSPYPQSGKPKSMEYFYRKAFPDKKSDLPISPLSFSNSSCTVDAFSAKRQLLGDDSSSQLTNTLNVKNKTKAIINESNEDSAGNVCAEECTNQNFDGNETGENCIVQKQSSEFNERLFNNKGEQETGIYENDTVKEKEGVLSDILGRKRKISESIYSDTCSTITNCSDLELMTPEKNDWLNKPLFSKDQSPMLSKKRKLQALSSSSDATPPSSPEKDKNLVSEPVCNSSQLFSKKSLDNSSPTDIACNSSAMQNQDIHMENIAGDYSNQKSVTDSEKVQQFEKSTSKTRTTSHKSPLHNNAEPSIVTDENKSLSELVAQDPKLNLLLSKIQIFGLDNILDRLKDK